LVDDLGSAHDVDGEPCVRGSPRTTSTSSGTGPEPERLTIRRVSPRRSKASSVARPIAPVPEDDVTCGAAHVLPTTAASTRAVPVGALCMGRSQYNKSPEGGERDGSAGAEYGELLVNGNPGESGDDPAERPE
jgi:hypothetical protein